MLQEYEIRPITVEEYHRMGDVGIIGPDERVELMDGELIKMPPIGFQHGFSSRELLKILERSFGDRAIVDVGHPVVLDSYSEPQPDVMLLAAHAHRYRKRQPEAGDVLLVVEIAVTSFRYDRGRKFRAYARSGIPEYWIVDVGGQCLRVFTEPNDLGYGSEQTLHAGETVAPRAFPDTQIEVEAILP